MAPRANLYGIVGRTLVANGSSLSETIYSPKTILPKHSHAFSYMCFVLAGDYHERLGGREQYCSAATLAFHPADETHSDIFGTNGGRCLNVRLSSTFAERMAEERLLPNHSVHFRTGPISDLASKIYDEFKRPDAVSPFVIEGLVTEIVAKTARFIPETLDPALPKWLERVREVLHATFSGPLHLAELAALVGRHPVHVARAFRRHFGCSIGEYTRKLRVEFSRGQLERTDLSLAEIALEAGFAQQSHFSATFRRYSGVSPSVYREKFRLR